MIVMNSHWYQVVVAELHLQKQALYRSSRQNTKIGTEPSDSICGYIYGCSFTLNAQGTWILSKAISQSTKDVILILLGEGPDCQTNNCESLKYHVNL